MGYGFLIAGMIFLCNPLINIVDLLPDCIGYFLILCGISQFAYTDHQMASCRKKLRLLLFVTLPKTVLGIFSLMGEKTFPILGESTMVLVYSFCFAIAEPILMWQMFSFFFDGIYRLGVRQGDTESAVLYRKTKKRTLRIGDRVRRLTGWFIVLRALFSVLPQFIFISDMSYMEYDIYGLYMDVRDAFPVLAVISVLIMLPLSVVWAKNICRYLRDIQRQGYLDQSIAEKKAELGEKYTVARRRDLFSDAFRVMLCGILFLIYVDFGGVDVLPLPAGVLLLFVALLLLRKELQLKKRTLFFNGVIFPISIAAYVLSLDTARKYFTSVWEDFSGIWGKSARTMLQNDPLSFLKYLGLRLTDTDRTAWDAQLWSFAAAVLVWGMLTVLFFSVTRQMRAYLHRGGDELLHRYCLETRADEQKARGRLTVWYHAVRIGFICTALLTVLSQHPLFYYFSTAVPTLRVACSVAFFFLMWGYTRQLYHTASDLV